jgi:hypothetical protein
MKESYVSGDGGYTGDSSDVIESDGDALYDGMPAEEFHDWIDNGNPVRFKQGTGYERPGVWNPSQLNVFHNRCWVGDEDNRGWYVSLDHLVPHHEGYEDELDEGDGLPELTAEDFVLPRNQPKSLADEVEKHDDENGEPEDQAYISRLRNLAGLNKI